MIPIRRPTGGTGLPASGVAALPHVSGSPAQTTGSIGAGGTALTVADASTFAVGHGVFVLGAGGGITPLVTVITAVNGAVLTLRDAAVQGVAGARVQHDDTEALQAIITARLATGNAELDLPAGTFRINRQCAPGAGGLLSLPPEYKQANKVLTLRGASRPPNFYFELPARAGLTILETELTGIDNTILYGIIGAPYAGSDVPDGNSVLSIELHAENLLMIVPPNGSIGGIQGLWMGGLSARNVQVQTGRRWLDMVALSNPASFGIAFPTQGNYGMTHAQTCVVFNVYAGYIVAEHSTFDYCAAGNCHYGVFARSGGHLSSGSLNLYQCRINVGAASGAGWHGNAPRLAVDYTVSFENTGTQGSGNFAPIVDLDDPDGHLSGVLRYEAYPDVPLTRNGGPQVFAVPLSDPGSVWGAVAPAPLAWDASGPSIQTDVALWLRADRAPGAAGDPVSDWPDAARGIHATQATAGARPVKRAGGQGGQPYLEFSGAQELVTSALDALAGRGSLTVLVVLAASGAATVALETGDNSNNVPGTWGVVYDTGKIQSILNMGSAGTVAAAEALHNTVSAQIITVNYAADPPIAMRGGNTLIVQPPAPAQTLVGDVLHLGQRSGGVAPLTGRIYEVLIFKRELSAAEQTAAYDNYLKVRYGL
ncbi:hypothetical protein [Deinococcus humi]|uniref:Uncharacterized protein n=1 Tax=Deinococcus humi TaxID=662880 RepID=A0A7W8NFK6_9DEIO|nr:hypothetical protein [Deinococcus humi]MBB5362057.1 hypothetical protein [Deinococcus humi]GGO22286.1 hypothetical protein GCM10008949_09380 [Deinococcus humi]